jgi:hypothetical protein
LKDLVGTDLIEYDIDIDPRQPPGRQRQYRFAKSERDEIERQVQELKEAGMIAPSTSQWRISYFLVGKKEIFDSKRKDSFLTAAESMNYQNRYNTG